MWMTVEIVNSKGGNFSRKRRSQQRSFLKCQEGPSSKHIPGGKVMLPHPTRKDIYKPFERRRERQTHHPFLFLNLGIRIPSLIWINMYPYVCMYVHIRRCALVKALPNLKRILGQATDEMVRNISLRTQVQNFFPTPQMPPTRNM